MAKNRDPWIANWVKGPKNDERTQKWASNLPTVVQQQSDATLQKHAKPAFDPVEATPHPQNIVYCLQRHY